MTDAVADPTEIPILKKIAFSEEANATDYG